MSAEMMVVNIRCRYPAYFLPAAYISITPIDASTAEQKERVNEPGDSNRPASGNTEGLRGW